MFEHVELVGNVELIESTVKQLMVHVICLTWHEMYLLLS